MPKARRDRISKENGKFVVRSEHGAKLGEHRTRGEALQQLRAVEYHKAHDASGAPGGDKLTPIPEGSQDLLEHARKEPVKLGELTTEDASGAPGGTELGPIPEGRSERVAHARAAPDQTLGDEGDPNQYEMLSTSLPLRPNEANEPGYAETSPSSGPDARKQGWRDPSGDNDWLAAIGAFPNTGGSRLE